MSGDGLHGGNGCEMQWVMGGVVLGDPRLRSNLFCTGVAGVKGAIRTFLGQRRVAAGLFPMAKAVMQRGHRIGSKSLHFIRLNDFTFS